MGEQRELPGTAPAHISGRATIDVTACRVSCDRCASAFESRELGALLRWSREHRCADAQLALPSDRGAT